MTSLIDELTDGWSFNAPVRMELVNYDQLFYNDPDAIVLPYGDEAVLSPDSTERVIKEVFQDGKKDLSFVSSCECGALRGNFCNGLVCEKCHTVCKTNFAENLKFRVWLEIPPMAEDINDPKFIPPVLHPGIELVLNQWLGKKKGQKSLLDSLLDPSQDLPQDLIDAGIGQGYQYFYRNFRDLINFFLNEYKPFRQKDKKARGAAIPELLEMYQDRLFTRHIPILNQALHLMTSSGTLNCTDDTVQYILKTRINISNLVYQHRHTNIKPSYIDSQMWSIHSAYRAYTNSISSKKLFGKQGYIRKLILGARLHCSARAVITPISGIHDCDELYLPWKMGVELLKMEIINLLCHRPEYQFTDPLTGVTRNYTVEEANRKQTQAVVAYDPDVDSIMRALIKECHDYTEVDVPMLGAKMRPKGLPVLFGREPTLRTGAIMLYFVTKIKTNLEDLTISVSSRCSAAPNLNY